MGKNLRLWGADGGAPSIWLIVCEITYFVPLGLAELQRSLSVSPWKTENTNIYTRVCICSPMSRACVFRFCQTTPKLQLWAIHLNADSTACFFGGGGACVRVWQSPSKHEAFCFDDYSCIPIPRDISFFISVCNSMSFHFFVLFALLALLWIFFIFMDQQRTIWGGKV